MAMTEKEKLKYLKIPKEKLSFAERILKLEKPEIPQNPQKNVWYRFSLDGLICANGEPYRALVKLGNENKLAIIFCGGGVAVDDYTSARPITIYGEIPAPNFYFNDVFMISDTASVAGLGKICEENPLKDWNILVVNYATGDFHVGRNDYGYSDSELGNGVIHHNGYINYSILVEKVKQYVSSPEKILVTGFSAGGFGTALLTDDVMDRFPDCTDVTCCVDSAILLYDGWKETAIKQWKAPKEISERFNSDNITLDNLLSLNKKRGDRVKIMLVCSSRDKALAEFQCWFDSKRFEAPIEYAETVANNLRKTCEALIEQIPRVALYIFDRRIDGNSEFTHHTVIMDDTFYTLKTEGVTVCDWLSKGLNGALERIGLDNLK